MRRLIFLAILMLVAPLAANAADGRKYAVLSLVGDKLLVVQREMSTGSRLDRNSRVYVDLPDSAIDRAVTLAVDDALRQADPGSAPILLAARDPKLYAASASAADRTDGVARVFEAVRPILANSQATHLLLVTKHRHRAMLRLRDGHVGTGFLEGVGFYVDHGSLARGVETNEGERGFIAPFTYLRIALVEIATGKVVAEERVVGSEAATFVGNAHIGDAWHALTDQDKVSRLTRVIREETARAVPMVLARR